MSLQFTLSYLGTCWLTGISCLCTVEVNLGIKDVKGKIISFVDLPSQLFLFSTLEYYEQRIVFKAHTAFEIIEISFHICFYIC